MPFPAMLHNHMVKQIHTSELQSHCLLLLTTEQLHQSIWGLNLSSSCRGLREPVHFTGSFSSTISEPATVQSQWPPFGGRFQALFLLMHVCTWPVTFHPALPLTNRRGVRSDGRDHYITKHPAAIVLSNCHTTLPQHCPQTTGQVLCATAQTQRRERKRRGKEKVKRKTEEKEGMRDQDKACLSPGSKSQLFSCGNT